MGGFSAGIRRKQPVHQPPETVIISFVVPAQAGRREARASVRHFAFGNPVMWGKMGARLLGNNGFREPDGQQLALAGDPVTVVHSPPPA